MQKLDNMRLMNNVCVAIALVATSALLQKAQAKSSPYMLDTHKEHVVTLRNASTGRIVWTRKDIFIYANWSADHGAVVVEVVGKPVDSRELLIWRRGYRLLRLDTPLMPPGIGSGNWDYTMGCLWPPDKKRFLVRAGGSGDSTIDLGDLFCCKLDRSGKARYSRAPSQDKQGNFGVRKMKWRDNRTVLFWTVKHKNNKEYLIPHLWRVP